MLNRAGIQVVTAGHQHLAGQYTAEQLGIIIAAYDKVDGRIYFNERQSYWRHPIEDAKRLRDVSYISTDSPWHAALHEFGHGLHHRQLPRVAYRRLLWNMTDYERAVAELVSNRAAVSLEEFVAEVYAAKVLGVAVHALAQAMYTDLGGIEL